MAPTLPRARRARALAPAPYPTRQTAYLTRASPTRHPRHRASQGGRARECACASAPPADVSARETTGAGARGAPARPAMWPQQQTSQNPLGGFGSRIDLSRIGRFAGGAAGGTALFRGAPDARDAGEPTAPAVAGGARPAGEAEFYGFKPPHGDARAETAATAPARWPPAGGGGGGTRPLGGC